MVCCHYPNTRIRSPSPYFLCDWSIQDTWRIISDKRTTMRCDEELISAFARRASIVSDLHLNRSHTLWMLVYFSGYWSPGHFVLSSAAASRFLNSLKSLSRRSSSGSWFPSISASALLDPTVACWYRKPQAIAGCFERGVWSFVRYWSMKLLRSSSWMVYEAHT